MIQGHDATIPKGWYRLPLSERTRRGDRYYSSKGEWVETMTPGSLVGNFAVYIREGRPPLELKPEFQQRPRAAQPKALKAARLKGT